MNKPVEKPLRVLRLEAENIKRLKAVAIVPADGALTIIGGRNEQGKSSVLDCIEMALAGARAIPENPVRHGARKARERIELGRDGKVELIVERTFSAKGTKLVVTDAEGLEQSSPQKLLEKLYATIAFDPMGFTRLDPKQQDAVLRQAVGVDLSDLETERKQVYDARTEVNREVRALEGKLKGRTWHPGVPAQEESMAALSAELEAGLTREREREELERRVETARSIVAHWNDNIRDIEALIEDLEQKLKSAKKELSTAIDSRDDAANGFDALDAQLKAFEAPDLEPIRERMRTAEETNRKVRENQDLDRLKADSRAQQTEAERLTERIESIDQEKAARLGAANFPIEGLSFDEDGPSLGGVPISQISQAQKIRLGCALGAALNPELRVFLVREGAFLDDDSVALLARLADEVGAQVWLERVGDKDPAAIIIEDGEVRSG